MPTSVLCRIFVIVCYSLQFLNFQVNSFREEKLNQYVVPLLVSFSPQTKSIVSSPPLPRRITRQRGQQ
ncbi:hypothetical protein JTE90_028457 [Oedothorax gibbosus]|uniref:Secreted protein n=1 Tax=Oedothorax gibbosus TaxID=931172 RepID=A0AAV6VF90_9ARAC|nr:hypothetical protein JTE90_028457 [Oedothorax gibbosus]